MRGIPRKDPAARAAGGRRAGSAALEPPIAGTISPVMSLEQMGEARKTYNGESFSGCAGRFIGTSAPNCATSFAGESAGLSGVHTGPGAIAFTRIPLSSRLSESDRVKAWMPPFVIE
jgi:hypothetical protein